MELFYWEEPQRDINYVPQPIRKHVMQVIRKADTHPRFHLCKSLTDGVVRSIHWSELREPATAEGYRIS